jgi:menaquinone-9 beta-reductase
VGLIERDPDPAVYKKICTHFIQPSATPAIERLGIADVIDAAGGIHNDAEIFTRWDCPSVATKYGTARLCLQYSA